MSNRFSLKIAYIIFLIVCVVYYFISNIIECKFENWEKIVCGTTIASYFFMFANTHQSFYSIMKNFIDAIKASNKKNNEIKNIMIKSPEKYKDSVYSIEDLDEFIKEDEKMIIKYEKAILKCSKRVVFFNTLGFLAFFCILTFNWFFQLFEGLQEVTTMLAFVMMLMIDTYEEYWIDNHSWLLKNYDMEENNNDQTQNAHP